MQNTRKTTAIFGFAILVAAFTLLKGGSCAEMSSDWGSLLISQEDSSGSAANEIPLIGPQSHNVPDTNSRERESNFLLRRSYSLPPLFRRIAEIQSFMALQRLGNSNTFLKRVKRINKD